MNKKEEIKESKKYADKSMELIDLILKTDNVKNVEVMHKIASITYDIYQLGFDSGNKYVLELLEDKIKTEVSVKLFDKE